MCTLHDLLTTWENWSARNTLTRALAQVSTDDAREAMRRGLAETPVVDPLEALRDAAELVALLSGWEWQTVYAVRLAGSSWEAISAAMGTTVEDSYRRFVEALDAIEHVRPGGSLRYREML